MPLPTATDDHQRKNAEALVRRGAADVLEQAALDRRGAGGSASRRLLADAARLAAMRQRGARRRDGRTPRGCERVIALRAIEPAGAPLAIAAQVGHGRRERSDGAE